MLHMAPLMYINMMYCGPEAISYQKKTVDLAWIKNPNLYIGTVYTVNKF